MVSTWAAAHSTWHCREQPSYLCQTAWFHRVLCMPCWISRPLYKRDVPMIPFRKRIISWMSLQVVFSAWAKILKNLPPHPFADYCPICLMSVSIPVSLSSASPSFLALFPATPSHDTLFTSACYYLNPAYLNNSLTSLAVHVEENIPFYSRLSGGIHQSDKRKAEGFTARAVLRLRKREGHKLYALFSIQYWLAVAWSGIQYEHEQEGESPLRALVELCRKTKKDEEKG